jgi:phosphomannomutase
MVSISGIRGIIGETLTPEIITNFSLSYGTLNKSKKVIISRDTRGSGEMVLNFVKGALIATGCHVIDIGVATTPTIEVMIEKLKASGGVMVSASHNPIEWNAMKFFNHFGQLMTAGENNKLLDIYNNQKWLLANWEKIGTDKKDITANESHIELVLKNINYKAIKAKKFKVALDSINGAGGEITLLFLKELGCQVLEVNTDMSGKFAHKPEPIEANLKDFVKFVKTKKIDAAFIQDPDADRLVILDEKGLWLGEEYTTALCVREILKVKKSPVVVNMSTSRMNEDIANEFGCKFYRSKVGEANVVEMMKKKKSIAGGEGNGGIIAGNIHFGRDSLVGIGYLLQGMTTGEKVSDLVKAIPSYAMLKTTLPVQKEKLKKALAKLTKKYKNEKINSEDGIRIDFKDKWVHLRSSNTEPIIRIISEAKTTYEADNLIQEIKLEF